MAVSCYSCQVLGGIVQHSAQIDDTAIDNMTRSSGRTEHQYNTKPRVGNILANPSPLLHKWKANGYVIVCQMFLICLLVDERTPGCHQWITIQHAGSNFNCSLNCSLLLLLYNSPFIFHICFRKTLLLKKGKEIRMTVFFQS